MLRRNKQPLMKLHCDIMGIMKAPSSCRVPGQSLLSTMPKSALQSSGSSPEKNAKVSLNYLLEVTSGTFPPGPCARGSCGWDGLSEPHNYPTTDVRPAPPSAV